MLDLGTLDEQDAPAIHLSYHDGEHYNSVRRADDHTTGPALPSAIAERTPTSAEKAAARSWGPTEEEQVVQGTGCYDDPAVVRQALEDVHGDPDQVSSRPMMSRKVVACKSSAANMYIYPGLFGLDQQPCWLHWTTGQVSGHIMSRQKFWAMQNTLL